MIGLRVAPIVEGHGEVEAVRILLERAWREIVHGDYIDVLRPIRMPRSKLLKIGRRGERGVTTPDEREIGRAVELAAAKLRGPFDVALPNLILILLDADYDCPKDLAPAILEATSSRATECDIVCVLAKAEYETWFVAAAESLADYLTVLPNETIPEEPEQSGARKGWIAKRFKSPSYKETVDQPRLTAAMDLKLCRQRAPSFDKLCRELARRA